MTHYRQILKPLYIGEETFFNNNIVRWVFRVFAFVSIGFFLLLSLLQVFAQGICCADDGTYAHIAKNIANGIGYATTFQLDGPDYGIRAYDHMVGTGPAVILPAAIFIAIFGNHYWIPGITVVIIWFMLFIAVYINLHYLLPTPKTDFCAALFILTLFALFPYHFEHFYALLGEIPAAFFILFGIFIIASQPFRRLHLTLAGLLFSFAVLSKMLSLLWFVVFVCTYIYFHYRHREKNSNKLGLNLLLLFISFAMPLAILEVCKCFSLGLNNYIGNVKSSFAFINQYGLSQEMSEGIWNYASKNLDKIQQRFGISAIELFLLSTGAYIVVMCSSKRPIKFLASALYAGFIIHTIWWLCFSIGWPRYLIIDILLVAFLICLPIATLKKPVVWAGYLILLICFITPDWSRVRYCFSTIDSKWFNPNTRNRNALKVSEYLDQKTEGKTVFTQWWAMISAFEYQSAKKIKFKAFDAINNSILPEEYYVLLDERWLLANDANRIKKCHLLCGPPVIDLSPYKVFICGQVSTKGS